MSLISYIHAADLHLDAPLQGISNALTKGERLTKHLRQATFLALDRLEALCLEKRPDFLLLCGDICNSEEQSIRARLRLHAFCTTLETAGIPIFMIHGNHDPLESAFQSMRWPQNVHIFDSSMETVTLTTQSNETVVLHGISHATKKETRCMAELFKRDESYPGAFQIGLLHANEHAHDPKDSCAPFSLKMLLDSKLDAYALGHLHKHRVLCTTPFIAYCGSIQGLSIHEPDCHGCLYVQAHKKEQQWECTSTLVPLAPILWKTVSVSLDQDDRLDQILKTITTALEKERTQLPPNCRALMVRLIVTGRTPYEIDLTRGYDDLVQELSYLETTPPEIWLHSLHLETQPCCDMEDYRARDDLLGAVLEGVHALEDGSKESRDFITATLAPLFDQSQWRKILERPDQEDVHSLVREVEKLCISALEEERVYSRSAD